MTEPNITTSTPTDLSAEEVMLKIDELVNVANYLKRVAKPLLRRHGKKRAKTEGSTRRNGFAVPVTMHERLVKFLNKHNTLEVTTTTTMPRTEVTAMITAYIKANDLQTPENRKNFKIDTELAQAFNVEEGLISNWFQMQKHLSSVLQSVPKPVPDETPSDQTKMHETPPDKVPADQTRDVQNPHPPSPVGSSAPASAKRIKRG